MSEILLLVSNCNKEIYGNVNKANHFFVDLPQEYHLSGNWSVGLRELVYSNDISTIVNEILIIVSRRYIQRGIVDGWVNSNKQKKDDVLIKDKTGWYFKYEMDNPLPTNDEVNYFLYASGFEPLLAGIKGIVHENRVIFKQKLDIPLVVEKFQLRLEYYIHLNIHNYGISIKTKSYDRKEMLVKELNKLCKKWEIKFHLDDDLLVLSKLSHFLDINISELQFILGFNEKILKTVGTKATHPILLKRGIYSFYIYLNICQHIMVGDTMVPLLRSVNIDCTELKGVVTRTIDSSVFIPISHTSFKTLEIQICDDKGELVPFGNDVNTQLLIELKKL
jgi:hypothetical protein